MSPPAPANAKDCAPHRAPSPPAKRRGPAARSPHHGKNPAPPRAPPQSAAPTLPDKAPSNAKPPEQRPPRQAAPHNSTKGSATQIVPRHNPSKIGLPAGLPACPSERSSDAPPSVVPS